MSEVREFLTALAVKGGDNATNELLAEILIEDGNIVHCGEQIEHRWYIEEEVVTEIEGIFIKYTSYIITGDACMDDMGLKYDLDNAKFVTKKTRTVIEVYYA